MIIVYDSDKINVKNIKEGILIVYATWSLQAIVNTTQTIQTLYHQNYSGQIIVIDIDCMTSDFQVELFGHVCNGWGEISVIHCGQIIEQYLGKDCFTEFKTANDDKKHSW